jgi:hypothetical protein
MPQFSKALLQPPPAASRWAAIRVFFPAEPAHVESHFSFSRMLSGLEKCAKEKAILGKGSAFAIAVAVAVAKAMATEKSYGY